ncbi:hypothetical protein niasHT_038881 [Heterodera trifolii]|uniref:DRBM domain-containing protein n=1 Tax=Heterodera trifolii TaxID=157864 RepID=A0ABD2IJY5_9BILA
MFNSCSSPQHIHQQQQNSLPMANGLGGIGFDLLNKQSQAVTAVTTAQFVASQRPPPPLNANVKQFTISSNAISSSPPPPASVGSAPIDSAIFHGQKMPCRRSSPSSSAAASRRGMSPSKCRAKSSSPSPSRQQQKHRNGSLMGRPSSGSGGGGGHRRRAVHQQGGRHGTGGGSSEPSAGGAAVPASTTTIRYNYAQRKDSAEKTPMCRLAELARANHLKHEYVLLDESGPAHCKQFVVKLVLRPGLEFDGSGPSIKKAQQSAAQAALDRWCQLPLRQPPPVPMVSAPPLPLPPFGTAVPSSVMSQQQHQQQQYLHQKRHLRGGAIGCGGAATRHNSSRRDDTKNPVCLLNNVAAQLGINLHYREESFSPFNDNFSKSLQHPSFLTYLLPQALCPAAAIQSVNGSLLAAPIFANLPHQQRQQQQQNTSGTFQPPPFGSPPPHASAIRPASQMNTAQNGAAGLLSNALMLPPPPPSAFNHSLALANPLSASLFNPSLGQLQYHHHYHHHHHVLSVSPANGRHHINPFPLAQPNRQNHAYKVTVRLSKDGTEHTALGPTLTTAKQKAATLALAHLRPELEQLKRLLKETQGTEEEKQIVPKLVTKIDGTDQQRQLLLGCDAASKCHHIYSSSPTDEVDQQQQYDGLKDDDDEAIAAELVEPVPLEEAESCREELRQSANKNAHLDGDEDDGDQQLKNNAKFAVSTTTTMKQAEQPKLNQRQHKKYKSVVSQIHECALQLRMNVEFEMVAEFGEPHNRTYTVSVRLFSPPSLESHHQHNHQHDFINGMMEEQRQGQRREFVADGQGLSKKAAKQAACQKLLGQVKHQLELDPIQLASSIVRPLNGAGALRRAVNLLPPAGGEAASSAAAQQQQQNLETTTTSSSSTKRKTIIKDKKIDPNYGTGVNPISRLIQVMQARGERDPMFQVIGEHGQNRHKEFTVSVQCMGEQEQGNGPNKKLAKRAAAEAMLAKIGYVKPMPQPGKSLLKKSSIITTINNTENKYNTSADFALPSTPEKVPMPIIDMFVVPPEEPDITENDNDNASQQNNKQIINQCQTTFMEQQWHQQDQEEEEEQDGGMIAGSGGGWHHKATEELARVPPKQRQAVPKGLETFADVEQQCFSSTTIDEQQQQFVQHHLQQQQRCIHEAAQHGNSDNADKVVLNNDNCDSDYQRLNWVNPPSLEMEEEQEADFLHGHGHVTQQLHHRHRSADDDDHCASSPSELGSAGSHSPDNDGTPSRASGDALHHHHHHRRRRVTFSDTVRACPPPGASESADSVAPLKSELCTKPRRRLRPSSKDSQRVLSEDETKRLACATALFLAWPTVEAEKCGLTLLKVNGTNPTTTPTTTSIVQTDHGANQVAAADQVLVDDDELLGAALQTVDNVGANKALLLDENGGGTIAPSTAVPTTLLNNSAIVSLALAPVCNSNRLPTGLNMTTFPSSTPTTMLNSIPVVSNFNSVPIQSLASLNTNLAPPHANAIRMMLPSAAVMGNNNNNMTAQSAHSLNNNGLNSMNCLNRMFAAMHLNVPPPSVAPPFNKSCLNLSASSSPPQITMPPPSIFSVPPPTIVPPPVPQLQPIISAASPTVVVMPSSPKPPPQFSMQQNTQCQKFKLIEAKQFLEKLASVYKFTVVYSDFPKTRNDANEEQCFSLVTLGFAKPIVCHGSGPTKQVAHNDAALNAIRKCNNN